MIDFLNLAFYKFAAKGWIPAQWFEPELPELSERQAKTGRLSLEIVSHCWNYSHFLVYQLSSLVLFPPSRLDVKMTVFYAEEDHKTTQLLDFFSQKEIANITWNWRSLPKEKLFRRGIGRNLAALETNSDWVWFTDCDLMFRDSCLDTLAELLQGRREALCFPEEERTTELLAENNPILKAGAKNLDILDIETQRFVSRKMTRATGPLQIAHGDVCRAVGYCRGINIYQKPSEKWTKAHEDRAFRWLLRSQGTSLPIPGVYRIRHIEKGRYSGSNTGRQLRMLIRKVQSWLRDRKTHSQE